MVYALVRNNIIEAELWRLPGSARRLSDGAWVSPPDGAWTVAEHQSCGYFVVADVQRPSSTASDWTRSLTLVGGVPTVTWTSRPWTQAELDAQAAAANEVTIDAYLDAALALLTTIIDRPAVPFTQQGVRDVQRDAQDLAQILRRVVRKLRRNLSATT